MKKTLLWIMPGLLALAVGVYVGLSKQPANELAGDYTIDLEPALLADVVLPDTLDVIQNGSQWHGKVVVLNHWASWCPPCVEEIPLLIEFQHEYQQRGLQIVGVAHDTAEAARVFGDQIGLNYPSLVIESGGTQLMASQGNSMGSALPFTAIFNRDGLLVKRKLGIIEAAELAEMIEPLL